MASVSIRSRTDLKQLRESLVEQQKQYTARILICMTGCRALGAQDVSRAFREAITAEKLEDTVAVVETGCIGLCAKAPMVRIEPYDYVYGGVTADDVGEILETTIKNGEPVLSLCVKEQETPIPCMGDTAFFKHQTRTVLENCGRIDPCSIEDAIRHGAYSVAADVLSDMPPDDVVEAVVSSGLRGRGGAGFPTGIKWRFCRQSGGTEKYLICNADEGDPGAFMDRALLEGDPHRVIEGMLMAAYAIGTSDGFVYVRT